jgi:hypothetical protein
MVGREASPTAAVIDSQSVKSAEKGGASIDPNGFYQVIKSLTLQPISRIGGDLIQ